MKRLVLVLALGLGLAASAMAGPALTHTGSYTSAHFDVRYRPGSRAGAMVESTAAQAERALARICQALGVENDGQYKLYLYDGVPELQTINGNKGVAGFAANDQVHVPIQNLQTLAHEIAHVVTHRLPRSGDEPRNMMFPEAIANALLAYVHGVPVHAVAKYYRDRKRLPRLSVMADAKDFYGWMRTKPGLNAYDIGASWMRFLIDTHGMPNTLRYYTGTPAKDAFGASRDALERTWHQALDRFAMRPEVETLLKIRHGETAAFDDYDMDPMARLPEAIRGKPSDWNEVIGKKIAPAKKGEWTSKGKTLAGSTQSTDWSWCVIGKKSFGDAAVTAVLRPAPGCVGVALSFAPPALQGLLTNAGTFLFNAKGGVGGTNEIRVVGRERVMLTLVRRGTNVEVFVDGHAVLKGTTASKKGAPAVGVAGGSVVVESVRVRKL